MVCNMLYNTSQPSKFDCDDTQIADQVALYLLALYLLVSPLGTMRRWTQEHVLHLATRSMQISMLFFTTLHSPSQPYGVNQAVTPTPLVLIRSKISEMTKFLSSWTKTVLRQDPGNSQKSPARRIACRNSMNLFYALKNQFQRQESSK